MITQAALPGVETTPEPPASLPSPHPGKRASLPIHLSHHALDDDTGQRQAELFYLQKQIQSQTPMVVVLADGEKIEGCIEWYDRRTLKVRGRDKVLIYKSAIKYMYKVGEAGF
jgi:sRNA-binding regulator protein Hfq